MLFITLWCLKCSYMPAESLKFFVSSFLIIQFANCLLFFHNNTTLKYWILLLVIKGNYHHICALIFMLNIVMKILARLVATNSLLCSFSAIRFQLHFCIMVSFLYSSSSLFVLVLFVMQGRGVSRYKLQYVIAKIKNLLND